MRTNNAVNISIIGCGRISKKHCDAIARLEDKGVKLHALADLDIEKTKSYDINDVLIKTDNYQSKGFFENADLAVILTESGNHYEHAKYALKQGLDVLIEKPVTLKLEDAYELKNLAQSSGKKIYVVKQNRFNEPIQRAREFVARGFLGQPQIASVQVRWCRQQDYYDLANWRGTWRLDGGVISNQASHHIDLMRWFMGEVKSVYAIDRRFGVDIEAEDTVIAVLEFESGAVGTIEATTSTRPRNLEGSFSVQGDIGSFEVGGFAVNEMRYIESQNEAFSYSINNQEAVCDKDKRDVYGSGHFSIYEEILKDRLGKENEAITIESAIEALEVIHMIYVSIETGERVINDGSLIKSSRMGV